MTQSKKIEILKNKIIDLSNNSSTFEHREWFVDLHLKFVEHISLELCEVYRDADKDLVKTLVWIHDYPKILDKSREHDPSMTRYTAELLSEIGFDHDFSQRAIDYYITFEKKLEEDLSKAPIEVQIVSSADAAAHLVGPFWSIFWKENSQKSIQDLMQANISKLKKDWERKVTLPEIKKTFQARHDFVFEQLGNFPDRFL